MQRLIALLLDSDKNSKVLEDCVNTYRAAPRAYRRAVGALHSMTERHPWRMSVSLAKRKGPASSAGNPATIIVASCKGVFNDRGWEARIPVIENDGEIFVENPEGVGLLLANSSEADSSGYVYAYPIQVRALLASTADAILHIANDASMQSGRTEYFSDRQGGHQSSIQRTGTSSWNFSRGGSVSRRSAFIRRLTRNASTLHSARQKTKMATAWLYAVSANES